MNSLNWLGSVKNISSYGKYYYHSLKKNTTYYNNFISINHLIKWVYSEIPVKNYNDINYLKSGCDSFVMYPNYSFLLPKLRNTQELCFKNKKTRLALRRKRKRMGERISLRYR